MADCVFSMLCVSAASPRQMMGAMGAGVAGMGAMTAGVGTLAAPTVPGVTTAATALTPGVGAGAAVNNPFLQAAMQPKVTSKFLMCHNLPTVLNDTEVRPAPEKSLREHARCPSLRQGGRLAYIPALLYACVCRSWSC